MYTDIRVPTPYERAIEKVQKRLYHKISFAEAKALADMAENCRKELGEIFAIAGGDTDNNPGPHHASRAKEVVQDLRDCYEQSHRTQDELEAVIITVVEELDHYIEQGGGEYPHPDTTIERLRAISAKAKGT